MSDGKTNDGGAGRTVTISDGGSDPFDRLAEEFAEQCRRGESPSIEDYEACHPEHAERIRKLFPTVALMEQLKRGSQQLPGAEPARPAPERLGEFRIIRELGRGGMGVVYEAVQESLGRHVAVKVIHHVHLDVKRLHRFQREAQAVARLHHTNIVPIFGVGEHEGLPYYVMQYIPGRGLDVLLGEWRRGGAAGAEDRRGLAAQVGVQAAEALQYAHEQGVLHRDIKPANLLIDEQRTVWITDFGLAKLTGHDDLTASGDVIGTLRYLAPEALRGETDARSDVYSLGLVLYELLTLNPPFGELTPSELLRRVGEGQPERPRRLDPAIPRDLETIVLKAIARDPDHRYPTAGALADDLRRFLEDRPIRARRANAAERAWRWSRRNRTTAALAAAVAGSLLLAAVVGWIGYVNTARALRRADENVSLSLAVFEELFDRFSAHDVVRPPPPGQEARRPPPEPGFGPDEGPPPPGRPRPRGDDGDPFAPPPTPPGDRRDARDRRPPRGREGPTRPDGSGGDTPLLRSVLTFYDRFAGQNATNPRLQGEAAWAYRKVGSLYERLGRVAEAEAAYDRAIAMFEELVARYPDDPGYRLRLVQTYDMADPLSAGPASLGRLERRLGRARGLIDRLAAESPANPEVVRTRIRVHMKLGSVLKRLGRTDDAEACYRRVVDLTGANIDRPVEPEDRRLDRATAREALALLELGRGRPGEARTLLEAAAADLHTIAEGERMPPPLAGRFATLAEAFEQLGDPERAGEMARWADEIGERQPHVPFGPHGRGPEPPRTNEGPP